MNSLNAAIQVILTALAIMVGGAVILLLAMGIRSLFKKLFIMQFKFKYKSHKVTKLFHLKYKLAMFGITAGLIDLGYIKEDDPNSAVYFDAINSSIMFIDWMYVVKGYCALPPYEAAMVEAIDAMRRASDGSYKNNIEDENYVPGQTPFACELMDYAKDTEWQIYDLWSKTKIDIILKDSKEGENKDDTGGI